MEYYKTFINTATHVLYDRNIPEDKRISIARGAAIEALTLKPDSYQAAELIDVLNESYPAYRIRIQKSRDLAANHSASRHEDNVSHRTLTSKESHERFGAIVGKDYQILDASPYFILVGQRQSERLTGTGWIYQIRVQNRIAIETRRTTLSYDSRDKAIEAAMQDLLTFN